MSRTARSTGNRDQRRRYGQGTIGNLRKRYGAGFAKGHADNEKIADVIRKQPSLMTVILRFEEKWFEEL
jgi:hypothetical protein